ncbi:hypothetical protein HPP92_013710 [Vanilla planifolia]|uniref:ATP-dependent Clp protease proteolytic subunit n=1 Tax=Vanilla planifolia TaxID=51239 RepID=A0A835QQJ4_VANPL|nr:hypothetical protein HPP92_013710 [Vanilla planifolia]
MPMVPAVTELVVAQLLYLQWMDPMEPIYIYINSTGTTRDDGEPVAMEAQGLAIYDVLMQTKSDIYTLCLGVAAGQACLLLAAGQKGKRFMMPSSYAIIQQPRIPSYGMMQASDIAIRAKEVLTNRDTLVQLLAKHTGNPTDAIHHIMRRVRHMNAKQAIEFGVIDKILQHDPPPKTLKEIRPRKEWNRIDTRFTQGL